MGYVGTGRSWGARPVIDLSVDGRAPGADPTTAWAERGEPVRGGGDEAEGRSEPNWGVDGCQPTGEGGGWG